MRSMNKLYVGCVSLAISILPLSLTGCTDHSAQLTHTQSLAMATASQPVMQWATEAALTAYNYDNQSYTAQQQKLSTYFMPDAWTNYQAALKDSGELNNVRQHELTVSANVSPNTATVSNIGLVNGKPSWIVSVPIDITYKGKRFFNQQHRVITMVILEVPNSPSHQVAINQFVVQ